MTLDQKAERNHRAREFLTRLAVDLDRAGKPNDARACEAIVDDILLPAYDEFLAWARVPKYAPSPQPHTGRAGVTEEMVRVATLAILPWLKWKPSAPETIARAALNAALTVEPEAGEVTREAVIKECAKAIEIAAQQPIHSGEMRYVAGHRLGIDRSLAAIRSLAKVAP